MKDQLVKSVVVTGASTGIGRAISIRMAGLGWRVFAGVRKKSDRISIESESPDHIRGVIIDVTDGKQIQAAVELVAKEGGGLDVLVNNAGVAVAGPLESTAVDEFRRQFEINVFGQVALTQAFLPMIRKSKGRIVNMSSLAGRLSQPFLSPYCASKHALEAVSDSLRIEMEPFGVDVVVVQPGSIKTPIWNKGQNEVAQKLNGLSPAMRSLYGASYEAVLRVLKSTGNKGISASEVAAVVEEALLAKSPKSRYAVGRDAKMGIWAKRWFSDSMVDRQIVKLFRT